MATFLFTVKEYLNTQKQIQTTNKTPVTVPTIDELAAACGMKVTPFSRMINNRTESVSRIKIALLIAELNRRGFYPSFNELFAYYE